MAVCENCGNKWSYFEILKRTFKKKKPCPYCGAIQYATHRSAQRMSILSYLQLFVWILLPLSGIPRTITLAIAGAVLIVCLALMPVMTGLTGDQRKQHPGAEK